MRALILIIGLAGMMAVASEAAAAPPHARPHHRPAAHRKPSPAAGPAHHMSALAAAAQRRRQEAGFTPVADGGHPYMQMRAGVGDARFGVYRRSYKMDADRPLVRPDEDGAVGLSFKIKTH